jgi:hypothetical protein
MMLIIMLCHRSFTPQVPPVHSNLERAPCASVTSLSAGGPSSLFEGAHLGCRACVR